MRRAVALAGALAALALCAAPASADPITPTIDNSGIRFDVDGNAIDAHDAGGGELYSPGPGQDWRAEPGRDLRFETLVAPAAGRR